MIAAVPIVGVEWYFRAGRLDGGVQASSWGDPWWHWQRPRQVILGPANFPAVFFSNQLGYSCPLKQYRLMTSKRRTIQFENNESEEDSLVRQATLRTIRCTTTPMDLVCVELAGGRFATNFFIFYCR